MKTLLILLVCLSCHVAAAPNVLFIAADDLRNDLGCYGEAHMVTPHLDTLASQGRLFRNHYVAVPTCGASRYALMTGLRPTSATDENTAFNFMPTSPPASPESWVDLLRRHGWHTASIGKITHEPDGFRWEDSGTYDIGRSRATFPDMRYSWHEIIYDHSRWGAQRYPLFTYADGTGRVRGQSPAYEVGVDAQGQSLPDEAYPDGQMALAAIDKLREFAADGTRFCLGLGFFRPHLPFNAPKAYWDLYDPATLPPAFPPGPPVGAHPATITDSGEINAYTLRDDRARLRHAYYASVSYVDAQIGKVLAELDHLGLAENTIVIVWGDHGWCFDDYGLIGKHKVLERSLEAPLIIRAPQGVIPAAYQGLAAEGVVSTIDIYPTIADLCGLDTPPSVEGESLLPMIRNPFAPGKNHVFSRYRSLTSVRSPEWRLIAVDGSFDLYDLSQIRYEQVDVASSHPATVTSLRDGLTQRGTRAGLSYADWAASDSRLADPADDADGDGSSNELEYLAGSDALDRGSMPQPSLSRTAGAWTYEFTIANLADDGTLMPQISSDLMTWNFQPLSLVEISPLGGDRTRLRFQLADPAAARRFFRMRSTTD